MSSFSLLKRHVLIRPFTVKGQAFGNQFLKSQILYSTRVNLNLVQDLPIEKWTPIPKMTPGHLVESYKSLSKAKLAGLVTLSTMCGYAIAPGATNVLSLLWTTVGTGLCISSANSLNQWVEIPYDAQMSRTRNRVLVRHALTPQHAFTFGASCGVLGVATLYNFVNPTVAFLGLSNIILYTSVYTPLKRYSIVNTWIGAVVGAIPPMMGWAACTGTIDSSSWLLALALYAWQFPHFNSLSWNLRSDYSKAGYQMMAVTDPNLNARVSLRYALAMFPISVAFPCLGLTTWWFAINSSFVNTYMAIKAFSFWSRPNDKSARSLFFSSLIHLPVFFALMLIHKNYSDNAEGPLAFFSSNALEALFNSEKPKRIEGAKPEE
ncbi:Protoheme IX farnesyltransferase, mitochondrial [Entomophthora muscae]|uniref:Protoheme IX farnesyltransferase, mitochondrial n=1 Tax=Entomophthora muscae TaxID=34485 RepID=A0ACC2SB09_9FUNG|nr:Protoheme IX farnesyltransferase, mitochondrial [Entomophthora muscae]